MAGTDHQERDQLGKRQAAARHPTRLGGLRRSGDRRLATSPRVAARHHREHRLRRHPAPLRLPSRFGRQDRGRCAARLQSTVATQHQEGREGRCHRAPGHSRRPRGFPPGISGDSRAGRILSAAVELLPRHVGCPEHRAAGSNVGVSGRARRPGVGRHHDGACGHSCVVFLRRLEQHRPGSAPEQRHPMADDHGFASIRRARV